MKLFKELKERYSKENKTAIEAQRLAHEIAFAPMTFQVSRLMVKFGILKLLSDNRKGLTQQQIAQKANISDYAAQVLLEASLSIGTVLIDGDLYVLSKAGWFLLNDKLVQANLNFNHDVNYLGLFSLEQSLIEGRPEGLKVFGNWPTIYEGLSQLPPKVQDSWFKFDHFYSDQSFQDALKIVFSNNTRTLLDVGGNTGRWATQCVAYDDNVNVTIMDLPQQLEMMREKVKNEKGADRIHGLGANLLNDEQKFPSGYDAIWMSQFLDCFSETEVTSILKRAAAAMYNDTSLYIMETFWDRQKYETAAYCLTLTSIYFTALANGNSKMYHSDDMMRCVENAGLKVVAIHDGLGMGHSIFICKRK